VAQPETTRDALLIRHALMVGLAGAIPVPLLDDFVKRALLRRLVRRIAAEHRVDLWQEEVSTLADEHQLGVVGSAMKGALLFPIKRMLKKTFVLLAGKKIVDDVSDAYHRGWLLERAFAERLVAPTGPNEAQAVRAAIDAVMAEVPLARSPVWHALKEGMDRSRGGLETAYRQLRRQLERADPRADEDAIAAIENADQDQDASWLETVEQLRRQLSEVPEAHFSELAARLAENLQSRDDATTSE